MYIYFVYNFEKYFCMFIRSCMMSTEGNEATKCFFFSIILKLRKIFPTIFHSETEKNFNLFFVNALTSTATFPLDLIFEKIAIPHEAPFNDE